MPESGRTDRTKYLTETRNGYTAIEEYYGNTCVRTPILTDRRKSRAQQIAKLLNAAYQRGREELMAELMQLAHQKGGMKYMAAMLNPNEKNDDGSYVLSGDELQKWWQKTNELLDQEDAAMPDIFTGPHMEGL